MSGTRINSGVVALKDSFSKLCLSQRCDLSLIGKLHKRSQSLDRPSLLNESFNVTTSVFILVIAQE